jgi:hypothetical protein
MPVDAAAVGTTSHEPRYTTREEQKLGPCGMGLDEVEFKECLECHQQLYANDVKVLTPQMAPPCFNEACKLLKWHPHGYDEREAALCGVTSGIRYGLHTVLMQSFICFIVLLLGKSVLIGLEWSRIGLRPLFGIKGTKIGKAAREVTLYGLFSLGASYALSPLASVKTYGSDSVLAGSVEMVVDGTEGIYAWMCTYAALWFLLMALVMFTCCHDREKYGDWLRFVVVFIPLLLTAILTLFIMLINIRLPFVDIASALTFNSSSGTTVCLDFLQISLFCLLVNDSVVPCLQTFQFVRDLVRGSDGGGEEEIDTPPGAPKEAWNSVTPI